MNRTISLEYKEIAQEFTKRAVARLGGKITAILLYGSVSRGEANKYSDIDLLVLSNYANSPLFRRQLSRIATKLEEEDEFSFYISIFPILPKDLLRNVRWGVPFIRNVKKDAVELYGGKIFQKLTRELS
ncbi:MAG: nucleotidyltransferase domain-containing protein [Candidatus Parvarchaeota archaeon]|jgi:predicted nucleotidyltransferase|nr:nucleotidyltransferase domain-containing protein [Candidatus Parvarchaeota archaeon]MCL5420515.1 nucleotidyltransferase domain-containing protein [Candidatus Parvarchaeota archaeon]